MKRLVPQLCFLLTLLLMLAGCGAESALRKADQHYALGEYYEAASYYKKAYGATKAKDKERRAQRAFMMGECYRRINSNARALGAYQNAVRYHYPDSIAYLHLANLLLQKSDYKNAVTNYQTYLEADSGNVLALNGLESCKLAPEWKKNPTRHIVKKETFFNSRRSEYSPAYGDADGTSLYFTSTRDKALGEDKSLITGVKAPDIFVASQNENGKWQKPEAVEGSLNTEYEDGACCFTPDFQTMYLTRCATDESAARPAQIVKSSRSDASWAAATVCDFITDTISSYAHPAVSPDGAWLYFVSDLGMDAMGGYDIYRISISGGQFGGIENLGPEINTPGDEMFPTFRQNGDLYFSSNGRPGMGGLDIFCAHQEEDGHWTVTNMQSPVNSPGDDFGMTFQGPYNRGFFSSNRNDGRGMDHIFSFELPETIHNLTVWVYEKDGYALEDGLVYLIGNDGTNEKINVKNDGSFVQRVTPGVSYVLLGTCKGFLNYKQELVADSTAENREYELYFPLSSITRPVLIDNIFYEFDKATLTEASTAALDELVNLLNDNPNVTIELSAHCDYKGNDAYNERLSQRRAESVVNYLIAHGIEKDRLTPKGYGESKPKTVRKKLTEKYDFLHEGDVLTESFILALPEEQQEICNQLNRRTEFKVIRTTYHLFD
ncbi:MAG: OmpA family protein [Bacteroidaceae bacterium]|nr:OmpA family protein [Bacteroidaceae bacterium]MBR5962973.1 OmpA family protein [Bacteroidaceae bacterium]